MTKSATVAITGRDFGCTQRSAMVTARESHEEAFPGGISHKLHRILNRLCAPHVELDPPLHTESTLALFGELLSHQNFFLVQVLAGELRQSVQLSLQRISD